MIVIYILAIIGAISLLGVIGFLALLFTGLGVATSPEEFERNRKERKSDEQG